MRTYQNVPANKYSVCPTFFQGTPAIDFHCCFKLSNTHENRFCTVSTSWPWLLSFLFYFLYLLHVCFDFPCFPAYWLSVLGSLVPLFPISPATTCTPARYPLIMFYFNQEVVFWRYFLLGAPVSCILVQLARFISDILPNVYLSMAGNSSKYFLHLFEQCLFLMFVCFFITYTFEYHFKKNSVFLFHLNAFNV